MCVDHGLSLVCRFACGALAGGRRGGRLLGLLGRARALTGRQAGQGQQDHPAYGVAVAASEVLADLGITLQVNDVGTAVWNNAIESNTAEMWAAAWQSTVDPDMTQVYHSSNAHGNGTNSNHYSVDDPALDELIVEGRSSADTEYRKSVYKNAMEIIMDWGCELPLYQRKECTVASSLRVVTDTMPHDMTPYWGWYAEIETLEVQ